jgi:hypothetical protein
MEIKLLPRIIGDDGKEIRDGDLVIAQTKDMDEPSLAVVNKIDTTILTMTFTDILYGNTPKLYRKSDIKTMIKSKQ